MLKRGFWIVCSTLVLAAPAAASLRPLPFIEDDVARARAEAKTRHLPIFVDVWAPW